MDPLDALPRTLDYRPNGMCMWDTWGIEHGGVAHLFHLQIHAHESRRSKEEASWLGHAVSRDLIHWEERPPAFGPNPVAGSLDDLQPWTGCVFAHGGRFFMYYTMRSSRDGAMAQHIGLATSADLDHWERHPGNPVISPDPRWYVSHDKPLSLPAFEVKAAPGVAPNVVDCRDLIVVNHPSGRGFLGFYAARAWAEESPEQSVIAAVRSDDLIHWTHLPPAFAPKKYNCIEVPDVFELNGRWYMTCLTGQHYGNRGIFSDPYLTRGTIWAVADKPEGPYHEVEGDNVLIGDAGGSSGYSCRSLLFAGKRYELYTQNNHDMRATLSPPFELRTTHDGRLRLGYSPRVQGWRATTLIDRGATPAVTKLPCNHPQWNVAGGRWRVESGGYAGESRTSWQVAELDTPGAADIEMEAAVTLHEGVAAGLVLRHEPGCAHAGNDWVFALDAAEQCVLAGKAAEFEDLHRRRWTIERGRAHHLRVCARGPRVEVFVDDLLAVQFAVRPPYPARRAVGLFVDRGRAGIAGLEAHGLATAYVV